MTSFASNNESASPLAGESQIGRVISVRGSEARIKLLGQARSEEGRATVGKFLGVRAGRSFLVGLITDVTLETAEVAREQSCDAVARVDLMGEIRQHHGSERAFQRGVTDYPAIGDPAVLLGKTDLQLIYRPSGAETIDIGSLHQDPSIAARIKVDDMLSKHFAVLGTTGVGKSSGVAVILGQVLEARPDLRIFLLDGHNEYGRCFGDRAHIINSRNLKLPFWLFNFEETVDVVFGGRPAVDEELEILAELIPLAKCAYAQYKSSADRMGLKRMDPKSMGYTVDTPVPYLLQDLIQLIDERMGRLENRASRMHYHRLMMRIETIRNDPRYAFMFENANVGGDTMGELLTQLFRLEPDGKPMTIMQLAGLPVEAVDAAVCVLCRLAFDFGLWSEGAIPLLFVCEEAHRYAFADHSMGFNPTRRALSRIAKEGRKHGVFLGLVTQRPAELDPTIISQCSTLFAMRMANDRDQALLRSAVSDAAANLLAFVPSLGTREVVGFGEGLALPVRLTFRELPADRLPRSEAAGRLSQGTEHGLDREFIKSVVERWRGTATPRKPSPEEEEAPREEGVSPGAYRNALDQARHRLLKRPLDAPAGDAVSGQRW